jgi:hypothetical protein
MPEPIAITTARINARKLAEELFAYAVSEAETLPEEFRKMVWSLLAYRIAEHTGTIDDCPQPQVRNRQTMSREVAIGFERGKLPFKTSKGDVTIGGIDLGFLHWLLDKHRKESHWFEQLDAYLNSRRVAQEEGERSEEEFSDDCT